ncbi:50S ribosomal protein L23 [Natronospira bacteriovora]|uniref:Large ribosomal subunit protein uL23 n=1 Tax=Natronospira bacteriovora TaxID=3069753 RepID=A0ABU0W9F9_9GAMM|nr:50S ribosomal protein L23 [Natronospira sp. AB-CW4]MDQ2070538.1 50S ribosomal protein L23 [Natronospira sp. AB-CW4]
MNQERLMTVLLGPHVSEKSTNVADAHNQVVFKVRRDATKTEIRKAVEKLFEVQVDKVRVVRQKGKIKRFGTQYGRRQDWKKAYVSLQPGQDIDFMGGAE